MMLESEITELRISGNVNFKQKKPEFFVNFPRSSDIKKLQFLIKRDHRTFLKHRY